MTVQETPSLAPMTDGEGIIPTEALALVSYQRGTEVVTEPILPKIPRREEAA